MGKYAVIDVESGWVLSLHMSQTAAEDRFRMVIGKILHGGDFRAIMPWLPKGANAAEVGANLAVMGVDASARPMQIYAGKMVRPSPTAAHNHMKSASKKAG